MTLDATAVGVNPLMSNSSDEPGRTGLEIAAALRPLLHGRVDASATARATYSTDASNYRHVPLAVVTPRSVEDVQTTLAFCHEHGVWSCHAGPEPVSAGKRPTLP